MTVAYQRFAQSLRATWQAKDYQHPLLVNPQRLYDPCGWTLDGWQKEMLGRSVRQTLVLCPRQVGKSATAAAKALMMALTRPGSLSVIISRSQNQAAEVLLKCTILHKAWLGDLRGKKLDAALKWCPRPVKSYDDLGGDGAMLEVDTTHDNVLSKAFENGSRIETFACKGETAVGTTTDLLILDEAARIPDPVYYSVRPTLAIAQSRGKGELICLSTPFGKRGWFYEAWKSCDDAIRDGKREPWNRVSITVDQCPRISSEFLDGEMAAMGNWWYGQEYGLVWTDAIDAVFRGEDVDRTLAKIGGRLFEEV